LLPIVEIGQRKPLKQRVRRAWLALRGPACFEAHELDHVEPFFQMLNELESVAGGLSREQLQLACAQHKSSAPANTLKLMTFHKAKGLEFDHVFLTGLAEKSSGDNRRQALLYSANINGLSLVAPAPWANESTATKAGFIKQYHKSIEDEEAARLLYVALTRAKKQLLLFATLKRDNKGALRTPQQGSLLRLLWPELQDDFERPEFQTETTDSARLGQETPEYSNHLPLLSLPAQLPPLELPPDIQIPPERDPVIGDQLEFSWAREDARIIGLVVHHILEFTDLPRLKAWQKNVDSGAIRTSLEHFGLRTERIENACTRVAGILRMSAGDARAHWLFSSDNHGVKSEWALTCAVNDQVSNFVIDRSFIDRNGVRWIVDFKTSTHEGSNLQGFLDEEEQRYMLQLKQYALLVQHLEPDREIRLGLYFPALAEWREIDSID
jgi:ATP-dependent helicase/nuclease subunit A